MSCRVHRDLKDLMIIMLRIIFSINWQNDYHVLSLDSQDEETDVFVAKEQRRFAHSAAEQKRRDAIRVSCYCVWLSWRSLCAVIQVWQALHAGCSSICSWSFTVRQLQDFTALGSEILASWQIIVFLWSAVLTLHYANMKNWAWNFQSLFYFNELFDTFCISLYSTVRNYFLLLETYANLHIFYLYLKITLEMSKHHDFLS